LFYGAGALGVVLSGATKATQRARLPLLALLAAALVGERLLVDKLHPWLDVNAGGEIVLALPVPTWLPLPHLAGTVITVGYKAAVRRVCMSLGVGLLVVVLFAHRDYERVNYRLLVEIREQQRRQEEDLRRLYQDQTMKARIAALAADTHRSRSPPTTQKERAPVGPVLDLGYQLTPAVESKDGGPSSAGAQALWLTAVGHTPQQAQERAVPSMLPSIPEREEQRDTAVERPASALGRRARIRRRTASVPDTENGGDGSKAPVRSTRRRTTAEESGKKDADAPEQGGTRRRRESSAGGEAQGQMQPSKRRKK